MTNAAKLVRAARILSGELEAEAETEEEAPL